MVNPICLLGDACELQKENAQNNCGSLRLKDAVRTFAERDETISEFEKISEQALNA
jgi:hypothetical protein